MNRQEAKGFRKIDIDRWPRKNTFNFFKEFQFPHFNITTQLEMGNVLKFTQTNNISLFQTILYLTSKVANTLPEFRYRLVDNEVYEYDKVDPSFILLLEDNTINFCIVDFKENLYDFLKEVEKEKEALKTMTTLNIIPQRYDLVYTSYIPWVNFTGFSNPYPTNSDSIPRIVWGKYLKESGKTNVPISIQAHHALMDGYHVGRYFTVLQEEFDNIGK